MGAFDGGSGWGRRRKAAGLRTAEVAAPSAADEAGWVFLAGAFVVLCVIYIYAFERTAARGDGAPASARSGLLPHQVLFRDLPGAEQRVFRQMQEGAAEAVRLRSESGSWPSTDAVAATGAPPFARDVLDTMGLAWSRRQSGLAVNYLGLPADAERTPAFLIAVQEPDPVTGEKPTAVADEEHQLLTDGTLLHVTFWKRQQGAVRPDPIVDPALDGWQQIRIKSPLEEVAEQ